MASVLIAVADNWRTNKPSNWVGGDPCGDGWAGIKCANSNVTSITLPSFGLDGTLSGELASLTELQILALSYNPNLTGQLPDEIGKLTNLRYLMLDGCGFSGRIPDLGSLKQLIHLSLNLNQFSGEIPASIGGLTNLYWLDLADNDLSGKIPISNGSSPGLNNLTRTVHFHFGNNQLSGVIPPELFSSNMSLEHVLFDNNRLTGSIPSTLGLAQKLEIIRLDRNSLNGPIPPNISNLRKVSQLYLSNNELTGSLPDLTEMSALSYVDLSNNSFDASGIPPWFSTSQSLTTLVLEFLKIQGELPWSLFTIPQLEAVHLKNNSINGTLNMSTYSKHLVVVDLENNNINYFISGGSYNKSLILVGNPYCIESPESKYCGVGTPENIYHPTPKSCTNCTNTCSLDQYLGSNCICVHPYMGTLNFRAPAFSDLTNQSRYSALEAKLLESFKANQASVGSVCLYDMSWNPGSYLQIGLQIFPANETHFTQPDISLLGFLLSNQTFKPPPEFGPFYFKGLPYSAFLVPVPERTKPNHLPAIIGVAAAVASLLVLIISVLGWYSLKQRRNAKREALRSPPFDSWGKEMITGSFPQLQGVRMFSFNELKQCTNGFADANDIGSGGYGRVYRGILPSGQLVAVKRAQQDSLQGVLEFKTEIEILSRVHHKNLVKLLGFCIENDEQMLVYDYIPNGSLKDSLSGRSGIHLDWKRRLQVALGAARGLAYLHNSANPPVVHRDIKSSNILLDDGLNAKLSDFGICKALDSRRHVTTQVKGTLGYLDPEYYMTQQLTEKSDVYSFGVLLLEMITAKKPIERNRHIVREVFNKFDQSQDLCGLHELIDPVIASSPFLKGFNILVNLAIRCAQELGAERPTMVEVVKEIENIMQAAGVNPNDSAPNSASHEMSSPFYNHPYSNEALATFATRPVPR